MAEDLKIIFQSQSENEAIEKAKAAVKKWYVVEPKATESLRHNVEYCFTYMKFPNGLWSKIRTTNILEREFREVRRRMKVFDNTFQSDESANRYANTIFSNLNNNYPLKSALHTKSWHYRCYCDGTSLSSTCRPYYPECNVAPVVPTRSVAGTKDTKPLKWWEWIIAIVIFVGVPILIIYGLIKLIKKFIVLKKLKK